MSWAVVDGFTEEVADMGLEYFDIATPLLLIFNNSVLYYLIIHINKLIISAIIKYNCPKYLLYLFKNGSEISKLVLIFLQIIIKSFNNLKAIFSYVGIP